MDLYIIFGISTVIGIISFIILFSIGQKKGRDEEAVKKAKELEADFKFMENKHYMLSLDVEKSRQKLAKSTTFLDGLKVKTRNVDIEQIKKDLEEK